MNSAQLRSDFDDYAAHGEEAASTEAPFELKPPALKQQVAERLASHRARRGQAARVSEPEAVPAAAVSSRPARARSARIAAAVAERYAQSPTYRSFLASEAERSVQQAQAAAEIATINAQAIAVAQQQLMADLDRWQWTSATEADTTATAAEAAASVVTMMQGAAVAAPAPLSAPTHEVATPAFTVRLYEDVGPITPADAHRAGENSSLDLADPEAYAEAEALDEEIAFRKDPYFEENTAPEPIPANLIEFPRQLVAARKARPRRAEGPLLDDPHSAEAAAQLRIFEVQADQMSAAPASDSVTPEWTSIMLGALPTAETEPAVWGEQSPTLVPQTAPVSRRLLSGLVDGALIGAGTVAFVAAAVEVHTLLVPGTPLRLSLPVAAMGLSGCFAGLALVYLLLSFTVGDQTAGMRYARIGLCTFADENPTRRAMRRRLFAMVLSAIPLGLGFLWACLDEDRLGWHDRMSRMYQRAY